MLHGYFCIRFHLKITLLLFRLEQIISPLFVYSIPETYVHYETDYLRNRRPY